MVELAHAYLIDYLTDKKAELADELFDEAVVHKDVVRAVGAVLAAMLGLSSHC